MERKEITEHQAKIIVGAIRRKQSRVALFETVNGFALKPVKQFPDSRLGDYDCIGIFNKRTTPATILEEWNNSI